MKHDARVAAPMRLRRSELSTPGSSEKMMAKAAASDADLVFLDLEDAVAPSEKRQARSLVVEALNTLDWGRKTRAVRINALDTPFAYGDIVDVLEGARENVDIIILPKVKSPREVWWVDVLLTQIERDLKLSNRVGIEVLIEDVEAMTNVEEIAKSSGRLEALIFGPGDYSASQGITMDEIGGVSPDYPGDIWHYARNKIIIAARAAGIDAIDGPYAAIDNPAGYSLQCRLARTLGAAGKWAIHPTQIPLANEEFTPTAEVIARAQRLTAAYAEAESQGIGALAIEGEMVDAATARILKNVVDRAELLGVWHTNVDAEEPKDEKKGTA